MKATAAVCGFFAALALVSASAARPGSGPSGTEGTTILITHDGQPRGNAGRGYGPVISADGRFVAFSDGSEILVRDLRSGSTVVGSEGVDGAQTFVGYSISGDGRFLAFGATRPAPVTGGEVEADVFVRDLVNGTTKLVSRASGVDGAPGNHPSWQPSISPDGHSVAFWSSASNLAAGDTEAGPPESYIDPSVDVFVRDLQANTTTLVSRASGPAGAAAHSTSLDPSISGDGRFVAFRSFATNLNPADDDVVGDIYVRDLQTEMTLFVGRGPTSSRRRGVLEDVGPPSISADGQSVAFAPFVHFGVGSGDYWTDVLFVRNLRTGMTTLVSSDSNGAPVNGASPALSADGRYVAFSSGAQNLQPYLTWAGSDIFVRDLRTRRTVLVSRAADAIGAPGNGGSHGPLISGDGRLVVFESRSSNLHPEDHDRSGDIFLRDLGPPPPRVPAPAFCGGRRATTIMLTGLFPFRGTSLQDVVAGSKQSDRISGDFGRDRLCGGFGRDRLAGGPGDDLIVSRDRDRDIVFCGSGSDHAIVDARDRVRGCEHRGHAAGR